jgi:acetoin utilization deacetylase AcuC-like enzyme
VAVHGDAYLRSVEALSARGGGPLFLDTILNRASWPAALGAAGAALAAVDHAHAGMGHAFAAVRPPGHHALASRGMGFCLINNVVVAARQAQRFGRARVLIVDWDVHHGNGTQALVETDPSIRYVSLHQWPWYPGTGVAEERGVGNVFNVPRGPGHPPELYVGDLWAAIVAATTDWTPDLTLISAGFDAMRGDPLGGFTLEPGHYADLTHRLRERLPDTPIVGVLEGGYIPERLAEGAAAHVLALA